MTADEIIEYLALIGVGMGAGLIIIRICLLLIDPESLPGSEDKSDDEDVS